MSTIRELDRQETYLAYPALLEFLPDLDLSQEEFVTQVNNDLRPQGYRLVGSFDENIDTPAAIAGFFTLRSLVFKHFFYLDVLSTCAAFRGNGHATRLMQWLYDEANRLGCTAFHLDAAVGPHRYDAHRFYLNQRMHIHGYHFTRDL